jgi:arylsulfatase A-like enzyme
LLHVPLIVKLPGESRPRATIDRPVQLVDIVPTVLSAIGAPVPPEVEGEPLQQVTHASLAEEHINPEFVAVYGNVYNRALRVVYDGPYKLITTSRGEKHLFDLSRDPKEERDLAAEDPERVARMEARLESAMEGMDHDLANAEHEDKR